MGPIIFGTVLCLAVTGVTAAAGTVALGATCTPTDGSRADCADTNAICPSSGAKCTCTSGYTQSATSCTAAAGTVALGATCTPADGSRADCADTNAICPAAGAKCTCKSGYTQSATSCTKSGVNAPAGTVALGATCTPADGTQANCADTNAICPAAGAKCTCKSGYTQSGTSCTEQRGNNNGREIAFSPLLVFLAPVSLAVFMGQ
ncbi:stabilin-2-like [Pomacea canaliculata]|uniref:stabilin-2-like n=1 Tax=Pomacea canaliculata TaxID=400727 RepID=UPI000D73198E|nr:stabilin-2-like [Pomacea canaliculata]